MNLPTLESAALPDVELAVALYRAAWVLEAEGRKAVGACVFGAGSRMRMTADALHRSADVLLASRPVAPAHERRVFTDACESVSALAGFLSWEHERLESYCAALREVLNAEWRRDRDGRPLETSNGEDVND